MNTLGKTVVAIGVCLVIIAALFFSRDFGAPAGRRGDGFGTQREAVEEGMGNSYNVDEEIGTLDFDDASIYLCKTKDQNIVVCYLFKNRQQTKYYFESYYVVSDLSKTQWYEEENKVKTNFLVTSADNEITDCDNKAVECEEYKVVVHEDTIDMKLYYNRAEK